MKVVRAMDEVEREADRYLKWGIVGDLNKDLNKLESSPGEPSPAKDIFEDGRRNETAGYSDDGTAGRVGSSERDFEFEKKLSEKYWELHEKFQRATHETHHCEEWLKVITGLFPNRYLEGQDYRTAAWNVVRLAQSQDEKETAETAEGVLKDMGSEIANASKTDIAKVTTHGVTSGIQSNDVAVKGKKEKEGVNVDGDVGDSISVQKPEISISDTSAARRIESTSAASSPMPTSKEERNDKSGPKKSEEKGKQETGVENT